MTCDNLNFHQQFFREKRVKLTNYEALLIIEESIEKQKKNDLMSAKNNEMTQNLYEYLNSQPKYVLNSKKVAQLKKFLEQHSLTQLEMIQVINSLPIQAVDVELIIENCGTKLDDKNIDEIIALCQQIRDEQQQQQETQMKE